MSSVNKVIIIGNVGKDPEIRHTQGGDAIANFSIACTKSWKDKKTGEKKERTEWIRCVAFGSLANIVKEHVRKGDKLYLSGELQTRKWQDQSGQDRYSTEVVLQGFNGELVMLGSPKGGREPGDDTNEYREQTVGNELNDEIPF